MIALAAAIVQWVGASRRDHGPFTVAACAFALATDPLWVVPAAAMMLVAWGRASRCGVGRPGANVAALLGVPFVFVPHPAGVGLAVLIGMTAGVLALERPTPAVPAVSRKIPVL